jgi:hypothetical protein
MSDINKQLEAVIKEFDEKYKFEGVFVDELKGLNMLKKDMTSFLKSKLQEALSTQLEEIIAMVKEMAHWVTTDGVLYEEIDYEDLLNQLNQMKGENENSN